MSLVKTILRIIFYSLNGIQQLKYSLLVNQSKNRNKIVTQILKQQIFSASSLFLSLDPFISCLVHLIYVYYCKSFTAPRIFFFSPLPLELSWQIIFLLYFIRLKFLKRLSVESTTASQDEMKILIGINYSWWEFSSFIFTYIFRLIKTETGRAILRVIAGPRAFKVVLFARLTPIPFGLQNTIFGVGSSTLTTKKENFH